MANLTDQIVLDIFRRMETGELAPGDVVDEGEIAAAFEASRTPAREAFIRLEAMGLLHRRPRSGAVIFRPTPEEFLQLLEVHVALEEQAAGLAARRATAEDAAILTRAVEACEAQVAQHGDSQPGAYYQANLVFHRALFDAARNPWLTGLLTIHGFKLIAYFRALFNRPGAAARSAAQHRAILAAVLEGDPVRAAAEMRRDIMIDTDTAMDLVAGMNERPVKSRPAQGTTLWTG